MFEAHFVEPIPVGYQSLLYYVLFNATVFSPSLLCYNFLRSYTCCCGMLLSEVCLCMDLFMHILS